LLASILFLTVSSGCLTFAQAAERILNYHSDISIHRDGSMTVLDTIRVQVEGNQIQRGIVRSIPTRYRDRVGNRYVVDFDVLSVERDGAPEPWFTSSRGNGIDLYTGQRDRLLPLGEHEFRIEYRTNRQIGFFGNHDELWWNVNGTDSEFPHDSVSARVTLPGSPGIDNLTIEGWVGLPGSTETAVTAEIDGVNSARISASRALAPGEGLTFVMTWPKGIVDEPTTADNAIRLLDDNRGLLVSLTGLIVMLGYWFRVWTAHGRDPLRGTIFPHYQPPKGVSPASARHVRRMGYDQKAFSAALINLAVKGYVEIDENDGEYSLRKTDGGSEALAPGEAALMNELFVRGDLLTLESGNHATVQAAMSAHKKLLKRDNDRIHFKTNGIYTLPAIAILAATFLVTLVINGVSPMAIVIGIVSALTIPVFAFLMRAHTPAGRRLLDTIEGFRLYLNVAEKDELNLKNPPEITPGLFEAFLPYALALDVEQRWAERFNASLTPEQAAAYQPGWYHGRWDSGRGGVGNIGAATAAVTGAVVGSIAAAATPPGSSSGGGGGGFVGGGGGGGGTGGW
jgi:uncharacterized membrane protein YgcG